MSVVSVDRPARIHVPGQRLGLVRPRLQRLVMSSILLAVWAVGCARPAASDDSPDAGPPKECREYLDIYSACMHRLTPKTPEIAEARVASARAALERIADRKQLKQTCANAATQLRASCQ